MAMMIVDDDAFDLEIRKLHNGGRGHVKEKPASLRKLVAEEAISGVPTKVISEAYHVSPSAISAYKHDATSTATYDQPDEELKSANDIVREEIVSSARTRLLQAIEQISPERLQITKTKELASIAKDMSVIIKNTEPQVPLIQNNVKVVVYAPRIQAEAEYESLVVNS